jgi:hypothetical protein
VHGEALGAGRVNQLVQLTLDFQDGLRAALPARRKVCLSLRPVDGASPSRVVTCEVKIQ